MHYVDFDQEFPRRCISMLRMSSMKTEDYECTRLLAIGGTLVTATADRQFAFDTPVHIDRGGIHSRDQSVSRFLSEPIETALKGFRSKLRARHDSAPPECWKWEPRQFRLENCLPGQPDLLRNLISNSQLLESRTQVKDVLRNFRNGFSHGNVWLLKDSDLNGQSWFAESRNGWINGFALASTNPKYQDLDRETKAPLTTSSKFVVTGILISPFDLRALIQAWAKLLMNTRTPLAQAGSRLHEDQDP